MQEGLLAAQGRRHRERGDDSEDERGGQDRRVHPGDIGRREGAVETCRTTASRGRQPAGRGMIGRFPCRSRRAAGPAEEPMARAHPAVRQPGRLPGLPALRGDLRDRGRGRPRRRPDRHHPRRRRGSLQPGLSVPQGLRAQGPPGGSGPAAPPDPPDRTRAGRRSVGRRRSRSRPRACAGCATRTAPRRWRATSATRTPTTSAPRSTFRRCCARSAASDASRRRASISFRRCSPARRSSEACSRSRFRISTARSICWCWAPTRWLRTAA